MQIRDAAILRSRIPRYVAAAKDMETATRKFVHGLAITRVLNLEQHGTVEHVIRAAPPEVWTDWANSSVQAVERDLN